MSHEEDGTEPKGPPTPKDDAISTDPAPDASEQEAADDPFGAALARAHREADEAAVPSPEDGDDDDLSFGGEGEMTLDAFERAVSRAVQSKLGDEAPPPRGRPGGADELVASVLGALTGKDAKSALQEVRSRLAGAEPTEPGGAQVIDLQAARAARQRATEPPDVSGRIGGVIKDTFNRFLGDYAQRHGGSGHITIDAAFLRDNGPEILGHLFQGLAGALLPGASGAATTRAPDEPEGGAGEPEGGADAATAELAADPEPDGAHAARREPGQEEDGGGGEGDGPGAIAETSGEGATRTPPAPDVKVKVDLGSILAGLLRRRPPPS